MNACQSLPAVLIVFATVSSPLNGRWTHAQGTTPAKEAASSTQTISVLDTIPNQNLAPDRVSEEAKPNPFVPATSPEADTVLPEQAPTTPVPSVEPIISGDIIENPVIVAEEIATPMAEEVITEEVFVPTAPAAVTSVPTVQPEVFFDSPAPSQSDMRISKDRVTELRQQRALYRANQRMARMQYNQWMGREPLRPRWSPMPMMNSRYAPPTILVPVYINPR